MHYKTLVAAAAVAGLMSSAALADKWDMPVPYPAKTFHTVNIMQFAEDLKAMTDGKIDITVHPAGSLFKHPEIKNAVRSGQVQIGEFLLARLANENAMFEVDAVPFLATDYAAAMKLWNASKGKIEALLDAQGLKVLYAVPWPPQGLYVKKDVNSVDDLKGIKFRAQNKAGERLAQILDMVPTQIEVPDIPQAFATGRVEAMMTSPSTGANTRAWDYLTHFYHTQAWLPKNAIVINKKVFARLDKDLQKAVLDAAAKAEKRGWEMSKKETDTKIAELKKGGMKVYDPSDALKAGLKKVGDVMTKEWLEKTGADGKAVIDAYSK